MVFPRVSLFLSRIVAARSEESAAQSYGFAQTRQEIRRKEEGRAADSPRARMEFQEALEHDATAELHLSRLAIGRRGGDVSEIARGRRQIRRREDRVVQRVEGLEANLEVG